MSYFQKERGGRVHLGLAAKAGVVYTVRVDDYKNKEKAQSLRREVKLYL